MSKCQSQGRRLLRKCLQQVFAIFREGQKYYRNLKLAGQGNLQDQVTNSFEVPLSLGLSKAFIEEKRKIKKKHQFSCQVIVITGIQMKCE